MKKIYIRLQLLAAFSAMTISTFPGIAQQTTSQKIPSTRDQQSSWIITTPTRQFDPKTGRRLIGSAHRIIEPSIDVTRPVVSSSEANAAVGDLAAGDAAAGSTRGSALPSYTTFYSLYVNNQTVETTGAGTYSFQGIRVGTDPQSTDQTTTIPTYIVPVKITAPGGKVYDPTTQIPGQNTSTIDAHLSSPLFQKTNLQFAGQSFGTTQLMDAWVRAQNWTDVSAKKKYHLMLATPKILPALNLTPNNSQFFSANLGSGSGLYGSTIGAVDINYLDTQIRAYIASAQTKGLLSTAGVPIFVTSYNVLAGPASGYHDDVSGQVYTWVGYFVSSVNIGQNIYDDSIPSPLRDGAVLEHEFAELIDHPYTSSGDNGACSFYGYEVGDPLESGQNDFVLPNRQGNKYAFQDLTFYSYNIGDVPSHGINGLYTLQGTYTFPCSAM